MEYQNKSAPNDRNIEISLLKRNKNKSKISRQATTGLHQKLIILHHIEEKEGIINLFYQLVKGQCNNNDIALKD